MAEVIFEHEGTLDKFMGDAILAVFGAPFEQPDHAVRAVAAARQMRRALAAMNAEPGAAQLQMRIALNSGRALTGDIGSPRRREFTVLGDVVNTAARVEEVAGPDQILMTGATWERVKTAFRAKPAGSRLLRGRESETELYELVG
jgi:class 3 adenylate cyclase